jgi:Mycothiol maleylpyruvate isomerase N-terminal domain
MSIELFDWRKLFTLASDAFVEIVGSISTSEYAAPGLGVWTVRDLVGHASRAMLTIDTYLQTPATTHEIDDPITYFQIGLNGPNNADAIAERGREAGAALGDNPAETVRALARRVQQVIEATSDETSLTRPSISFGAYLPTRVFELTVHCLDLVVALDRKPPETLDEPISACVGLAGAIAGRTKGSAEVLLALTGRRQLPEHYSVV